MRVLRLSALVSALWLAFALLTTSHPEAQPPVQPRIPPGGFTPVFNEISILLTISPTRPSETALERLAGRSERLLMQNVIDAQTGIVVPSVFLRGDPRKNAQGRSVQALTLAADPAFTADSKLFGGELTVFVRTPTRFHRAAPPEVLRFYRAQPPQKFVPTNESTGTIEALSSEKDFPARVTVPVYYTFMSGGRDGKLSTGDDNEFFRAREPHVMEATVNSVPPDPETVIRSRRWTLIDETAQGRRWIFVEGFRFLGTGDYEHRERMKYTPR
jgi:hypothetical protein